MPKITEFPCLQNLLLRCVRSVVSSNLPFFFNCLIRTFISSEFQWRHSRRWPAAAFQKVHLRKVFQRILEGIFWTKSPYLSKEDSQPISDCSIVISTCFCKKFVCFSHFQKLSFPKNFHVVPPLLKCQNWPIFHVYKICFYAAYAA